MPKAWSLGLVVLAVTVIGVAAASAVADGGEIAGSGFLPEGRGWEKVSPADKDNSDVYSSRYATRSSIDGDRVMFSAYAGFGDSEANKFSTPYRASRLGPGNWVSTGIYPPAKSDSKENPATIVDVAPDLSRAIVETNLALTPDATGPGMYRYAREIGSSAFSFLNNSPVGGPGESFLGASRDYSHLFFQSGSSLTDDAPEVTPLGCGSNTYERVGGETRLVSRLPDPDGEGPAQGEPVEALPIASPFEVCEVTYTNPSEVYVDEIHLISDDGSRIFWTRASDNQLYLREDGARTIHVSASQSGTPESPRPAHFRQATPDGSKVVFSSCERLTDDSTAGGNVPCAELYMYDVDTGSLSDLSISPVPGEHAAVRGVVGISDDGSHVYFAAEGSLTADAPVSPFPKVYLWNEGQVTYVAELDGLSQVSETRNFNPDATYGGGPKESRVSPDGRFMTLASEGELTEDQTDGTKQMYVYDSLTDELRCASCTPGEITPHAGETDRMGNGLPGMMTNPFLNTALLPDGGVLFHTQSALVPADTNSQIDVYIWREGTGPRLISSGQSRYPSYFEDASANGRDLFFATREKLTSSDKDNNVDLYDARIGGGETETSAAANECATDDCRSEGLPVEAAQVPGSATFVGPSNQNVRKKHRKACRRAHGKKRRHCARGKHRHKPERNKRVER